MVSKQKERPVTTRQNQTRIRPPTTTASFVYQTPIPVCLPASNNGVFGILLINNVFNQRCLLPSGVLWYGYTVFRRTDVPIGRCTAFWSCRCVFTYHMVRTCTSFTVPSWYRPMGEIAPGCLLSAAALPGKAVCSNYQFSIAPIGEMAPGVPCKASVSYTHLTLPTICSV